MDLNQLRKQILKQIEQLPPEQEQVLKRQLEAMSDEELVEFIKKQQAREKQNICFFCEVARGNVDVVKVYENSGFIAFLDAYPAVLGHTIIITKQHKQKFDQLSEQDLILLYDAVKRIMGAFYKLGFAGYNLVINQGKAAGQNLEHFSCYMLPRKENDGVNFGWQKIQASKDSLDEIGNKIALAIRQSIENREREKIKKEALKKVDEIIKFLKERKP